MKKLLFAILLIPAMGIQKNIYADLTPQQENALKIGLKNIANVANELATRKDLKKLKPEHVGCILINNLITGKSNIFKNILAKIDTDPKRQRNYKKVPAVVAAAITAAELCEDPDDELEGEPLPSAGPGSQEVVPEGTVTGETAV